MAKRKKAANLATASASGFTSNPLLQQTQAAGSAGLNSILSALGISGGSGGSGEGVGGGPTFDQRFANINLGAGRDQVLDYIRQREAAGGRGPLSPQEMADVESRFGPGSGANLNTVLSNEQSGAQGGGVGGAGGADGQRGAFENFLNSLGYQSQLRSGMDAITGSRAARGLLGSGSTLKALNTFGQDLAQQGFGQYLGQLGQLASAGQAAATNQAGAQQRGQLSAAEAYLQPGALGKAFGGLTNFIGGSV